MLRLSLSLRLCSIFSAFPVPLNASFFVLILSSYHSCLPACVKIVQKIVKQLWTQTLHIVVVEFPETGSVPTNKMYMCIYINLCLLILCLTLSDISWASFSIS